MISDTTIAATQSLRIKDKFKINLFIALPAAVITIVLFFT
jgi:Na+/H+ antiporter NhaC